MSTRNEVTSEDRIRSAYDIVPYQTVSPNKRLKIRKIQTAMAESRSKTIQPGDELKMVRRNIGFRTNDTSGIKSNLQPSFIGHTTTSSTVEQMTAFNSPVIGINVSYFSDPRTKCD